MNTCMNERYSDRDKRKRECVCVRERECVRVCVRESATGRKIQGYGEKYNTRGKRVV